MKSWGSGQGIWLVFKTRFYASRCCKDLCLLLFKIPSVKDLSPSQPAHGSAGSELESEQPWRLP